MGKRRSRLRDDAGVVRWITTLISTTTARLRSRVTPVLDLSRSRQRSARRVIAAII
jgi:hypothetical protein